MNIFIVVIIGYTLLNVNGTAISIAGVAWEEMNIVSFVIVTITLLYFNNLSFDIITKLLKQKR